MDEKTREKMVSALENAILAAGAKDYEAGMAQASKLIAFLHNNVQMMQTKDAFRKTLDSCSEVSKSEEKIALMGLTMMPHLLRIGLKMAAKKAENTLPALPGGRPRAISATEAREILRFISGLHEKGTSFKAAKERASRRYGISLRTIERLWSKRIAIDEDKPTIEDVLDLISS